MGTVVSRGGGAANALAQYCLEELDMDTVVHIGADLNTPWKNGNDY